MESTRNGNDSTNVRVVCRFRPLNAKEKELGVETVQQISNSTTVRIRDPKVPEPLAISLDRIFDMDTTQESIYEVSAKPVVNSVLQGFNGTIFAYGQTSSGKTFTMQGYDIQKPENRGIIPRMVDQVFNAISVSPENIEWRLKVSIVQLYNEKVRDLLDISKQDLKIRSCNKKGIYIEDVTEKYVSEASELYALMQIGNKNRASCSTNMNQRSSRSHMIFLITIAQTNLGDMSAKTGKLFLVDLAGSQKVGKTGAEGKVLDEAKKINLSLTSLGKVIKALTQSKGNAHIPYRQSKLTRILQESLGGNARTTLIITCSPHPTNLQETISTLRFGVSAKKITNKAKINRELTVGQLQKQLEKVEKQLNEKRAIIDILQKYITDQLKASLPKYDLTSKKPEKLITQAHDDTEADPVNEDNAEQQQPERPKSAQPLRDFQDERVHILQMELESHKALLQSQTEKLNNLRVDFAALHNTTTQYQGLNNGLKQQINHLKREKLKLQQMQQKQQEGMIILSGTDKNIAAVIFNEVASLLNNDQRREVTETLKSKKWYSEIQSSNFNINSLWEEERNKIMKDLQDKIQRVNTLERNLELEANRNKLRQIAENNEVSAAQQEAEERYRVMEKNLEQLYTQYYEMATLQSNWKAECQIYERKLFKKCKQVKEMEDMINELRRQIDQYKEKQCDFNSVIQVTGSKLVKPIRGGNKVYQYK